MKRRKPPAPTEATWDDSREVKDLNGSTAFIVSGARGSRSSKNPSADENVSAFLAVQRLTSDKRAKKRPPKKNPAAVALGRLGGLKGGMARAKSLSPKRRKAIARKAARSRWGRPKSK